MMIKSVSKGALGRQGYERLTSSPGSWMAWVMICDGGNIFGAHALKF
jgi:hypothetical protein